MDLNPTLRNTTVMNSRPPACDRPRFSNRSRVAHRTDNSVVTFRSKRRKPVTGGFLIPTTAEPIFYPRKIGSIAESRYT